MNIYRRGFGLLQRRYDDSDGSSDPAAQNEAGASGVTNEVVDVSTRNQVIIGVVIGGVAFIAITAGILFFFARQRKWDRIRRQEDQLLALQAPPAYNAKSSGQFDNFTSPRPSTSLSRHVDVPPVYRTLPIYDPSRYREDGPAPVAAGNSRRHQFISPVHYPDVRPLSYRPSDDTQLTVRLPREIPSDVRTQSASGFVQQSCVDQRRSSMHLDHSTIVAPDQSSGSSSSARLSQDPRLPRRPKPVLSRLITNL